MACTSHRAFIDPFKEVCTSPTALRRTRSGTGGGGRRRPTSGSPSRKKSLGAVRNLALFGHQSPVGSPSNRIKLRRDSGTLASTGNLLARPTFTSDRDPESIGYDTKRGVTTRDLERRHRLLQDHPKGRWAQVGGGGIGLIDLPRGVSDTLERAYLAGELKCGVWDNGLFRDFDLAKMQEIPGLKELRRIGTGLPKGVEA